MHKFPTNSNKTLNNLASPRKRSSIIRDVENRNTIGPVVNKRNQNKSQFTSLATSKLTKQSSIIRCLGAKSNSMPNRIIRKTEAIRKSNIPTTSVNKNICINKNVLTDKTYLKRGLGKRRNSSPVKDELKTPFAVNNSKEIAEIYVQTNESEILNNFLIVGDYKIITPSKSVVDEIEKLRKEEETKKLLMAKRKFEAHSQKEEQHLDDLNEFLDKCFITRKPSKLRNETFEEDRKLIESMDELLQRKTSKPESITDIRNRIKQKEQELLSLFDHFQNKNERFGKTHI